MIRMAVIPFGRPGIISGIMLGLGRALGETMAVAMVLSTGGFTWSMVTSGNSTIAAEIALDFPDSSGLKTNTLVAAGLVLFAITLAVNMFARWIVSRRSEFSGAN
jgi:phosphate transport system permease protein